MKKVIGILLILLGIGNFIKGVVGSTMPEYAAKSGPPITLGIGMFILGIWLVRSTKKNNSAS